MVNSLCVMIYSNHEFEMKNYWLFYDKCRSIQITDQFQWLFHHSDIRESQKIHFWKISEYVFLEYLLIYWIQVISFLWMLNIKIEFQFEKTKLFSFCCLQFRLLILNNMYKCSRDFFIANDSSVLWVQES